MMAFNRDELYGRNVGVNPMGRLDQFTPQREPLSDIQDNQTAISVVNQQSRRGEYSQPLSNEQSWNYSNLNGKPRVNYHYQQQQFDKPQVYGGNAVGASIVNSSVLQYPNNPLIGGIAKNPKNDYSQQLYNGGSKTAIPDVRDRKVREREERIQREKEELNQLQQNYPFGRSGGGGGAPHRDREGNVVSNRRPYSQVREPLPTLHQSNSIKNFQPYNQNPIAQTQAYSNLNQSVDVGSLHQNYYQNASQQAKATGGQQQVPAKITSYESDAQRELRQKKQLMYQDELRIQMEEKKAKEAAIKRKQMEEDMRQEQRIREDIEREKHLEQQEKMKKEQQQNKLSQHYENHTTKNKGALRVQHSPVQPSSKFSDVNVSQGPGDFEREAMFQPESKRHLELNQMRDPVSSFSSKHSTNVTPSLINNQNFNMFNQMESNFHSQLHQLKSEMAIQQQQFENQLLQLRNESKKNIDERMRAEQELQRMKVNSQGQSQRPHILGSSHSQRDHSNLVRRSMAGMNNYEKMFFGGQSSIPNSYQGNSMLPTSSSTINYGQAPSLQNVNRQIPQAALNNFDPNSQGLGGKFEGSLSLRAESTFVPVGNAPHIPSGQQEASKYLNDLKTDHISLRNELSRNIDKYEGDLTLNQLENAIEEISEMNLGENYKHTQKVLQDARQPQPDLPLLAKEPEFRVQSQTIQLPEYKGILDQDDDMSHLAYQLQQANTAQSQQKQQENEEIKKEYLMRNIPMNPILESSNEHTFPSQSNFGSMLDQVKNQ